MELRKRVYTGVLQWVSIYLLFLVVYSFVMYSLCLIIQTLFDYSKLNVVLIFWFRTISSFSCQGMSSQEANRVLRDFWRQLIEVNRVLRDFWRQLIEVNRVLRNFWRQLIGLFYFDIASDWVKWLKEQWIIFYKHKPLLLHRMRSFSKTVFLIIKSSFACERYTIRLHRPSYWVNNALRVPVYKRRK